MRLAAVGRVVVREVEGGDWEVERIEDSPADAARFVQQHQEEDGDEVQS